MSLRSDHFSRTATENITLIQDSLKIGIKASVSQNASYLVQCGGNDWPVQSQNNS